MAENEDVNVTEVRRWAKEAGYDVPARGALKQEIYDAYRSRDQDAQADDEPAPDATPAGHSDVAGIEDEVIVTVESTSDAAAADGADQADEAGQREDEWMRRYRAARLIPDDVSDADVAIAAKLLRNKVSLQTLENGFIHYQRGTGTDEVQARLIAAGFLNGYASGQADETTVQAYARYQDSIGLPGTGIPERASLEALDFDVIE